MPFSILLFLYAKKDELFSHHFSMKFGTLYEEFNPRSSSAVIFYSVFLLRRFILALSIIYLPDYPIQQIQLFIMISVLYMIYVV